MPAGCNRGGRPQCINTFFSCFSHFCASITWLLFSGSQLTALCI
nr:MAG TPA: hypothetical protein [Caudoviricetes sp.]